MVNQNPLAVSRRIVAVAVAASVGLHLFALFGTPVFDLSWRDEPVAHLDAALRELPPPPKAPPAVRPRVVKPRPVPATPREATPPMPDALARADATEPEPEDSDGLLPADDTPVVADDTEAPKEITPPPVAHYPVHHLRLAYDLHYGENAIRVGKVVQTWSSDDTHYRIESVAEATGFFGAIYNGKFVQRATGTFGPQGLVPDEYVLERGSPENSETARFDWQNSKLTLTHRGEKSVIDLPQDVHDALSIVHQLYFMQPLPAKSELHVATSRKIGTHVYEVTGDETVDTPSGPLAAVHIRRVSDDGDRMELWLDPQHAMVPLRILAVDSKGTILDQRIRGIEVEPVATAGVTPQ